MEYLASGTPCIIFKLDGIPDEYFEYCYIVKDKNIDSLKNKIIEVCELNDNIRISFAESAKKFIYENKNPTVQCEKVIQMLTKLQ